MLNADAPPEASPPEASPPQPAAPLVPSPTPSGAEGEHRSGGSWLPELVVDLVHDLGVEPEPLGQGLEEAPLRGFVDVDGRQGGGVDLRRDIGAGHLPRQVVDRQGRVHLPLDEGALRRAGPGLLELREDARPLVGASMLMSALAAAIIARTRSRARSWSGGAAAGPPVGAGLACVVPACIVPAVGGGAAGCAAGAAARAHA